MQIIFPISNNKRNSKTNPWYDKECKSARRAITEAVDESLKMDKIKIYKALTKRKKRQYIRQRQGNLLHLSKLAPKKFWRQILTRKTKEVSHLHSWNKKKDSGEVARGMQERIQIGGNKLEKKE